MSIFLSQNEHSVWIISSDSLKTYLLKKSRRSESKLISFLEKYMETNHLVELFENKINMIFNPCFNTNNSNVFPDQYDICLWIRDFAYRTHRSYPRKKDIETIINQISSMIYIRSDYTIWNVCNDLSLSKGYMRPLFDVVLSFFYHKGVRQFMLYIKKDNPFFEKAVRLYLEKGFVYQEYNSEIISMILMM